MTVMGQILYHTTKTDEQVIKNVIQKHFGPTFSYYTPNNSLMTCCILTTSMTHLRC